MELSTTTDILASWNAALESGALLSQHDAAALGLLMQNSTHRDALMLTLTEPELNFYALTEHEQDAAARNLVLKIVSPDAGEVPTDRVYAARTVLAHIIEQIELLNEKQSGNPNAEPIVSDEVRGFLMILDWWVNDITAADAQFAMGAKNTNLGSLVNYALLNGLGAGWTRRIDTIED